MWIGDDYAKKRIYENKIFLPFSVDKNSTLAALALVEHWCNSGWVMTFHLQFGQTGLGRRGPLMQWRLSTCMRLARSASAELTLIPAFGVSGEFIPFLFPFIIAWEWLLLFCLSLPRSYTAFGEKVLSTTRMLYTISSLIFRTYTTDVTGTYNKLDADKKPLIEVDYRELHGSAIPNFNTNVRIAKLRCVWKQSQKDENGTPLRRAVSEVCFKHNGKWSHYFLKSDNN